MAVKTNRLSAPSRGLHFNTGNGRTLQPANINHADYIALIDPDLAFWSLVRKDKLGSALTEGPLIREYRRKADAFEK